MRTTALLLLTICLACAADPALWHEAEFESITDGLACPARIALRQETAELVLAMEVGPLPGTTAAPALTLGVAAAGRKILTIAKEIPATTPGWHRFVLRVPAAEVARGDAEWARFRFAAAAVFPGTVAGQPLYRVRYRHQDGRALHSDLSPRAEDWLPFDLNAYRQRVADRSARVVLAFDQPLAGKASIVIADAKGRRVRNLLGGQPFQKGRQTVEWDLLDDEGKVVPPGDYTWKSLHHTGIVPEYRFSFCNDGEPPWKTGTGRDMWGPDHSCITAVATCGPRVCFLGPCAEAGYQGVIADAQGVKQISWGTPTNPSHFIMASDGARVFIAADDGKRQLLLRQTPGKDWDAFANGKREIEWGTTPKSGFGVADASYTQADWKAFTLAGFAVGGKRMAVASRAEQALLLFDADSGQRIGSIPLKDPGTLGSLADGTLLAVSNGAILKIAPGAMTTTPFMPAGKLKPGAMTDGRNGSLFVIDEATHQIAIIDAASGRETGRLGRPGGAYAGAYDPERMVRPLALALGTNGWLWVTENRFNPKRVLAWDLATKKVVKEKFGPTAYGASGGGIDSADPGRFIGQGVVWKVDVAKRSAVPASVLFAEADAQPGAMHWRFLRRDGRTFLLGFGSANSLVELKSDGSGRLLACYGGGLGYCFTMGARLPAVFLETYYKVAGITTAEQRQRLPEGRFAAQNSFFVWSDRTGDGVMQADELEFTDRYSSGYWGADVESIDIVAPIGAVVDGRPKQWRMELSLLGWHPSGAPKWQPLAEGQAAAKPTLPEHWGNESAMIDRNGRMFLNADPLMAYAPDGTLRWTYPNRWAGVHGSHGAPLPSIAQMQGALFFLGNAPLGDGKEDVFVLNGNHGRFFAITSDGFYLDEFFKDVRMGTAVDAYLIGGECFGGAFGRGADGTYYLLSGHTDHRIFTVRGFDSIVRGAGGTVTVSPGQLDAADRRAQALVQREVAATARFPRMATPPAFDGSGSGWPSEPLAKWSKSGLFPVQVQGGWDATNLYLRWTVQDASPWSNHGADERLLFKTGDSVDLQIGVDPGALANRTAPVSGDVRVLIAPFQGKPITMLYRHRVAGTKSPVPFASPWRTENVDVVRRLEGTRINVVAGIDATNVSRSIVEAAIPLADLGLKPEPGRDYRADLGAIFGDPDGQMNQLRSYWSNQATGLVNDVPGEIMLFPGTWGTIRFSEGK